MANIKFLIERLEIAKKIIIAQNTLQNNSFFYQLEYGGPRFSAPISDYFNFEKRVKQINSGVYILDNFYIGKTNDIKTRIESHLQDLYKFLKIGKQSYNTEKDIKILINLIKGKKTNVKLLSRHESDEKKFIIKHAPTLTNKNYNRFYNKKTKQFKNKLF